MQPMRFILGGFLGMAALSAIFVAIDLIRLLQWKMRSCPRCHHRFAFAGWELGNMCGSANMLHSCAINGERRSRPWVVASCRYCDFQLAIRKAPVFEAA